MHVAYCTAYGGPDVIALREVPKPQPADNEALIRVRAATVSSGDARIRAAKFPPGFGLLARLALGVSRPRRPVLGTECAGVIEAAGARVKRFKPGDSVFAFAGMKQGCHAEFVVASEDSALAAVPAGFSFEEAAAISFGGTTALYFLRDVGQVQPGERVLVNGASGAVGAAAVQIAKHMGAHVTGISSGANADLVRKLGADKVIDYTAEDFTASGEQWDIILDCVGTAPFARSRKALNKGGRLLLVLAGLGDLVKSPFQSMTSGLRIRGGTAPERREDILELKALCEAGAFKPVIDSRYAFSDIAAAHARVDTGRKRGSVVIVLGDNSH